MSSQRIHWENIVDIPNDGEDEDFSGDDNDDDWKPSKEESIPYSLEESELKSESDSDSDSHLNSDTEHQSDDKPSKFEYTHISEGLMSPQASNQHEPQPSSLLQIIKVDPGKALVLDFPCSSSGFNESKSDILPCQTPRNTTSVKASPASSMGSGSATPIKASPASLMGSGSATPIKASPASLMGSGSATLVKASPASSMGSGSGRGSSSGRSKRKAKVEMTASPMKARRTLPFAYTHISEELFGSDDDDSEDYEDDDEKPVICEEEDTVGVSVGRDVRKAMSYLRDIEMDSYECEMYEAWKEFYLEERATAARNLIDLEDVERVSSPRAPNMRDESMNVRIGEGKGRGQSARGRGRGMRGQGGPSSANEASPFTWSDDYSSFHAQQETYSRTPGPTIASTDPLEIFLSIWDRDVMTMIVEETERYAWQIISAQSETEGGVPSSLEWDGTSVEEMYRFFAVIILMSFCVRGTLNEYWTTGTLEMSKFRDVISRNRFITLHRFLHFVDNQNQPSNLSKYEARMFKIQPIIDHCNKKFSALFVPGQWLSLDESLLLWKGHLSFVQCIRTKAARFGIKSFELCDSVTGYLVRTMLYGGKGTTLIEGPVSGFSNTKAKVVLHLMQDYLDCGHCLVMDNWYNQLFLTRFLKEHKTDVIGTMTRARIHVPPAIKALQPSSLERGAMVALHCGDISLTSWMDVKLVTMMSTYHGNETIVKQRAGRDILTPVVVTDYNKYMGGVDLKDGMLSMYLTERKRGSKWYMKVFKRMLNTSLLNAYIIYKANVARQRGAKAMTHRMFRRTVADGLVERFPSRRDLGVQRARNKAREARLMSARAVVHRMDLHVHRSVRTALVPDTNMHVQRRCAQCASQGRRHMVRWMCETCGVPLQPGDCFAKYHDGRQGRRQRGAAAPPPLETENM